MVKIYFFSKLRHVLLPNSIIVIYILVVAIYVLARGTTSLSLIICDSFGYSCRLFLPHGKRSNRLIEFILNSIQLNLINIVIISLIIICNRLFQVIKFTYISKVITWIECVICIMIYIFI